MKTPPSYSSEFISRVATPLEVLAYTVLLILWEDILLLLINILGILGLGAWREIDLLAGNVPVVQVAHTRAEVGREAPIYSVRNLNPNPNPKPKKEI